MILLQSQLGLLGAEFSIQPAKAAAANWGASSRCPAHLCGSCQLSQTLVELHVAAESSLSRAIKARKRASIGYFKRCLSKYLCASLNSPTVPYRLEAPWALTRM